MAKIELLTHPKWQRLEHQLRHVPRAHLLGSFELLLHASYSQQHPDFRSADDLEFAAGWVGMPGEFCEALVRWGFVDQAGDLLRIHDWLDHAPRTVQRRKTVHAWALEAGVEMPASASRGGYDGHGHGAPPAMRDEVFARDGRACVYCGATDCTLECEHVIPESRGGRTEPQNLVTCCSRCNKSKGSLTPDEWAATGRMPSPGRTAAGQRPDNGRPLAPYPDPDPDPDPDPREVSLGPSCPETAAPSHGPQPDERVILTYQTDGPVSTWSLTESKLAEWRDAYPSLDVALECRRAQQWLRDIPSRRKTARGMTRFLLGWLSRAQDRGRAGGGNGRDRPRQPPPTPMQLRYWEANPDRDPRRQQPAQEDS